MKQTLPPIKLEFLSNIARRVLGRCHHLFVQGLFPLHETGSAHFRLFSKMAGRAVRPPETEVFRAAFPEMQTGSGLVYCELWRLGLRSGDLAGGDPVLAKVFVAFGL